MEKSEQTVLIKENLMMSLDVGMEIDPEETLILILGR